VVYLIFELDGGRFALSAGQVIEVLPFLAIRPLPQAPHGIAGLFDFRGTPVPVVDLSLTTLGRRARQHFSTRIIVVRTGDDDQGRLLGLIAEKATSTIRRERADFIDSGVINATAPYLGPVASDERGLIQLIDPARLLSPDVRRALSLPLAS
jgi:chemotaxis-related protein WspB